MKKIVAVIGGGPAGMSCGLWLQNLGFYTIILEKSDQLGGAQKENPFEKRWYLGIAGQTGKELAAQFRRHIEVAGVPTLLNCNLISITPGKHFQIRTDSQNITAQAIVIATGQRFRAYETIASIASGPEIELSKRVCFNPGATPITHGQTVAVIGAGDNGLGTAIMLADSAKHIHLFVRSQMRAFPHHQKAVFEYVEGGKMTIHQPVMLQKIRLTGDQVSLTFKEGNQTVTELGFDSVCFRLGFAPNVEEVVRLLNEGGVGSLELNAQGHIVTDEFLRTSLSHIYAAGDVANLRDPCIATAVAHGAIAARSIEEDLRRSQKS